VTLTVPTAVVTTASSFHATVTGSAIGGPFTYAWVFGDGSIDQSAAANATHTYATTGSYKATVTVTDGAGRSATSAGSAVVTDAPAPAPPAPPAPAAALALTLTCTAATHGTATPCNVSATYGSANIASNLITSVAWDFGDGSTQTIANSPLASRTYLQAGSYLVTATVTATTTDGAKTATATKAISVN
jgi:PKD repeat protein